MGSAVAGPIDPYEKYSRFVADWDRYVAPWRSQTLEYAKLSVEYGKLALQSAFILNGGAMVALAPLIQNHIDLCSTSDGICCVVHHRPNGRGASLLLRLL